MKKTNALIAGVVSALMFTSAAHAGFLESNGSKPTIDNTATATLWDTNDDGVDDVTVAAEKATASYSLDFSAATATDRAFFYQPTSDLASGTQIWLKLTGATWASTNEKLYLVGLAGAVGVDKDAVLFGTEDAKVDLNNAADAHYVKFVTGADISSGTPLAIVAASSAPTDDSNDNGFDTDGSDGITNLKPIKIELDSALSVGKSVTLEVEKALFAGSEIVGGRTVAEKILTSAKQFTMTVPVAATSTIDVNEERKTFEEEGTANNADDATGDTDATTVPRSAVKLHFVNNSGTINDSITLDGSDELTLTLKGSNFTGLYDAGNDGSIDGMVVNVAAADQDNPTAWNANQRFVYSSANSSASITLKGLDTDSASAPSQNLTATDDIIVVLECDGTTALNTREFTMSASLKLSDENYTEELLSDGKTHTWGINGAQFVAPHMISRDGWDSYLVVKTTFTSIAADIFVDMLAADGTQKTLLPADLAKLNLEKGDEGGSAIITAGDLLTAAQWDKNDSDKDFSATVTITLPQSQVFVDGFKYGSGSTYPLAVYENKDMSGAVFVK